MNEEQKDGLLFVLNFALQVIENNDLQATRNKENWAIGTALEDQIKQIELQE